jgi:hypothetical protein
LGPLLITRFSKQLTPERANCSFSCVTHLCTTNLECILWN